ncbi:Hemolysin ahh1 (plasmid) [Vibrio scophthalmi]|nr:Hemolysin ahh1 [Vibrio scophthalmi]
MLLLFFLPFVTKANTNNEDCSVHDPVGVSINILSDLVDSSKVVYINARCLGDGLVLHDIRNQVIEMDKRYLIDFTDIKGVENKNNIKDEYLSHVGVNLPGDLIVISRYNKEIMYTPLSGRYDENTKFLDSYNDINIHRDEKKLYDASYKTPEKNKKIPNIQFYLNVSKRIPDSDCYIDWQTSNGPSRAYLCSSANISLIYHVVLQRSLSFQNPLGYRTPDAKFVKITIGQHASGVGIHLNNKLRPQIIMSNGIAWPLGGPEAEWSSTAVAKNYTFNFSSSNKKARIINTLPESNVNANFNKTKTSMTEYGISTLNPKELLEGKYSVSDSTSLSFDLHDYKIIKNSRSARNVSFVWLREIYPTAATIQSRSLEGISVRKSYPGDLSKIHPIAYSGFSPTLSVTYVASSKQKGTTRFTIKSSVGVTGFRFRSSITGLFGVRTYYAKDSDKRLIRFIQPASFVVDWENPIFLGAIPVNLQLSSVNNRCLSVNDKKITFKRCDLKDARQGFIYDSQGHYISVVHNRYCLDAANLTALKRCSQNLSQLWRWQGNKMQQIHNDFYQKTLAYSKKKHSLQLVDPDSPTTLSKGFLTTKLFNM